MATVVHADGLGKRYRLGQLGAATTLREALAGLGSRSRRDGHLWALRDVSFEVEAGATLGVVGPNGSGKSTLLRILSRITEPTTGEARTRGRVACLLEVGTGFQQELTGRDNILLNGAINGMTRRDVMTRFDDIVDFAGIGRFLDTPLKRYSTGMHLRLAFSVAAHLEPDILLVDEVLAVGDLEFQRRCLGRMQEAHREGRTVVFVSHDLAAVTRLCERTMWLDRGQIRRDGPTSRVLDDYASSFADPTPAGHLAGGPVRIDAVRVLDPDDHPVTELHRTRPFEVEIAFDLHEPCPSLDLAVYLTNADRIRVLDEALSDRDHPPITPGAWTARVRIPPILNDGTYQVGLWVGTQYEDHLDAPAVASITLNDSVRRPYRVTRLDLPWTLQSRDPARGLGTQR